MKILLTGHRGYLGARLYEYLAERGHAVTGVGRKENIGTITRGTLERDGIELVINCATTADRTNTLCRVGCADEEVNVLGVRQLVLALAGTEIGLLHISTKDIYGEVYGPGDVQERAGRLVPAFAVDEEQPFRPRTVYAKTKLMGEFIAESHPKTTIIRLSSGYTSHPHRRGNWILHFCRLAKAERAVAIHGSGKQLRDPIHADDLGALLLLIQQKGAWGYKLNAGGGMAAAYSVEEVLDMIDPKLAREFSEGGDWGYVSDITRAQKLVGWEPKLSLEAELRLLMQRVRDE
jgi:nucleoside-diphosphate-sugar epimerase